LRRFGHPVYFKTAASIAALEHALRESSLCSALHFSNSTFREGKPCIHSPTTMPPGFCKGGQVVIVPAERMPVQTGIAAIYRF
jgi:hypothetical protein